MNTLTTPRTQYAYASGSANTIRPTSLTYPSGRVLSYSYGTAGSLSDQASRVTSLNDGSTTLASYDYLGQGSFVRAASPQPTLAWTLVSLTGTNDPDTGDIYAGLDRFGRVQDNRWLNTTTSTDVDRIQYGYDRASNRIWRHNVVATTQGQAFDELYTYDGVQRLKDMSRGTLNSGRTALTSSTFGQCWTLDSTGNWTGFREDDTGNGSWDLVQSRTANPVNEITAITNTTGPAWAQPAYDANGNMTSIPRGGQAGAKNWSGLSVDDWSGLSVDDLSAMTINATSGATSFTATYDAWNRLITLTDPESGAVLQRNTYDARRFRITREDFGEASRHFYYTNGWQCLEERASSTPDSSNPDRQFVWGLRYIDDLIHRDRDPSGSGSMSERLYAIQDANWNVTALVSSTGSVVERYAYSAYGEPVFLTPSFTSREASDFDVEHLYCGYRWDGASRRFHARRRVYSPTIATWLQTDPIKNIFGMNLHSYVQESPISRRDPLGLFDLMDWVEWDLPDDQGSTINQYVMNPLIYSRNMYVNYMLGMTQGVFNSLNGVTDIGVGTLNDLPGMLGPAGMIASPFIPKFEPPDWSNDLIFRETVLEHSASKLMGGVALTTGLPVSRVLPVRTPQGMCYQELSCEAISLNIRSRFGMPLYKAGSQGFSRTFDSVYWSSRNPYTTTNYSSLYGLPENWSASTPGQFVLEGTVRNPFDNIVVRKAVKVNGNQGGGLEIVCWPDAVGSNYITSP